MNLLLVGYVPERTLRAIAHCERTFASLPIEHRVLIANSSGAAELKPPGWQILRGSNREGEFSGWQEGLDWVDAIAEGAKGSSILVNDTIGSYRHLSALRRWAFRHEIRRVGASGIVGFSDQSAAPAGTLSICGLTLPDWLSTYCLYVPRSVLSSLGGRIYEQQQLDACVAGGTDETSFFTAEVSPALQRHLRWWLFGGGWHKSQQLNESTQAGLTFKARCICAELLLSARAHARGFQLRDPMRRHPVAANLEAINSWRKSEGRAVPERNADCIRL